MGDAGDAAATAGMVRWMSINPLLYATLYLYFLTIPRFFGGVNFSHLKYSLSCTYSVLSMLASDIPL